MKDEQDSFWKTTAWTITIALLIGAGSGILATSYTSSYLEEYALELSKLTAPLRLEQSQPKQFPSSLEEALRRFSTNNLPSIVMLYPASAARPYGYREEDALTTGLILTSDGWMVVPKMTNVRYADLVMALGEHTYAIDRVVEQASTDMVFLKVKLDALNIVGFGSGLDVVQAQQVIVSGRSGEIRLAHVVDVFDPQGVLVSSDRVARTFTVSVSVDQPSFVFSLNGDLLGVAQQAQTSAVVVPSETFLPAFRSLLETGEIQRPTLGLQTISLAHSVGIEPERVRSRTIGALVPDRRSITSKGPADQAGIKPLDILLFYNAQPINAQQTLDELVAQSKPGEEVTLILDRDGKEITLSVVLGVIAD